MRWDRCVKPPWSRWWRQKHPIRFSKTGRTAFEDSGKSRIPLKAIRESGISLEVGQLTGKLFWESGVLIKSLKNSGNRSLHRGLQGTSYVIVEPAKTYLKTALDTNLKRGCDACIEAKVTRLKHWIGKGADWWGGVKMRQAQVVCRRKTRCNKNTETINKTEIWLEHKKLVSDLHVTHEPDFWLRASRQPFSPLYHDHSRSRLGA